MILNWPPVQAFLKTAPQSVVDASVVIVNDEFPILIVLNDPRILFFQKIMSCLPCESVEVFLSKLPLLIFSAFVFRRSGSQFYGLKVTSKFTE